MLEIITKKDCIYSKKTKMFLNANNIPFVEKDINECQKVDPSKTPYVIPDSSSRTEFWCGYKPELLVKYLKM